LPHRLLALLGRLPHSLLPLLGRLSSSVLHPLRRLPNLIGDPAQSTSEAAALLLAATGEPAYGVLDALDGLSGLIGDLTCGVLSLLGGSSRGILGLAGHLSYLICGLAGCLLGLPDCLTCCVLHLLGRSLCGLSGGTVSHRLGCLYNVADDNTPLGARALDLREVHAQFSCLAAGRVRGLDLTLTPDLLRVQVGDVFLRLVDGLLYGRVVLHQLLKESLEGFIPAPGNLIRQVLQSGAVLTYLLLEYLTRITEVLLSQAHRPLLNLLPGLLDALVQPVQRLRLSVGHLGFLPFYSSFYSFLI
jgi:hypothetical protein